MIIGGPFCCVVLFLVRLSCCRDCSGGLKNMFMLMLYHGVPRCSIVTLSCKYINIIFIILQIKCLYLMCFVCFFVYPGWEYFNFRVLVWWAYVYYPYLLTVSGPGPKIGVRIITVLLLRWDMSSTAFKTARMELKTTKGTKQMISRAATLSGQPLSTFVLNSAEEKAKNVIDHHNSLSLSYKEQESFFNVLCGPSKASLKLKKLMSMERLSER